MLVSIVIPVRRRGAADGPARPIAAAHPDAEIIVSVTGASGAGQVRLWETGVALRVHLFGLPHRDQGLEDVEFIGCLKREGRIRALKEQVHTSPRRWRDGWWRRGARNIGLLALYYVGVSPERLARLYERRQRGRRTPDTGFRGPHADQETG